MAYAIDPATGLPMFGGVPMPLTPDDMAAHGIQAPDAIPAIGTNPYGGLPADAMASNDPTALGGAPDVANLYGQPSPDAFRIQIGAKAPSPVEGSHAGPGPIPDKFATHALAGQPPPPPENLGAPKPISVAGPAAAPQPGEQLDPAVEAAMRQGGGGPQKLAVTSDTQKFTTPGAIPTAMSADIAKGQQELDAGEQNLVTAESQHQGEYLKKQGDILAADQQAINKAAYERSLVDQRIRALQAHTDAAQAQLEQAKPKELNQYWRDKGSAAQIATLVSVMLGGFVQGQRGGGPNVGVDMMNQGIDRWVNDQQQQYAAAKDKASVANNAYKQVLDQYGTPEAAQAALRLQALTAANSMALNQAQQIGTPDALAKAQLVIQSNQLERKRLAAQAVSAAGTVEHSETLHMQGGGNSPLAALKRGAEATGYLNTIKGKDNETRRTNIEEGKAAGSATAVADAHNDAAAAVDALAQASENIGGRVGAGAGEVTALQASAENKIAHALTLSGVSPRAALGQAKEMVAGASDKARVTGRVGAQLKRVSEGLRGDAVRYHARHATGAAVPEAGTDEPLVGEPE